MPVHGVIEDSVLSANMLDEFPEKPKGMHWRTYDRLFRMLDEAEERSTIDLKR
jgi:hypothetical protein